MVRGVQIPGLRSKAPTLLVQLTLATLLPAAVHLRPRSENRLPDRKQGAIKSVDGLKLIDCDKI